MPAKIVAGSITASAMRVEATLKRMKPPVVRVTADRNHAIRSNDAREEAHRVAEAVDACADPVPAQGEAEDEARQHQLEGIGGGAEHEAQHADPHDLVDEGREPREARGGEEEADQRAVFGCLRGGRHRRDGERRRRARRERERGEREDEVQHARAGERPGKAHRGNQEEGGGKDAEDGAQAIQEIEGRDVVPGARGIQAQHRGAHQREGRAQQDRLRREEERGDDPLRRAERACRIAGGGQHRGVSPLGRGDEERMEHERDEADGAFDQGIDAQRIAHARCDARAKPPAEREPADEHHQDHRLRVGGVPEEELQVVGPDGLVDEARESGGEEQQEYGFDASAQGDLLVLSI